MSKAYKPLPAAEELWELFSYNPLTGNLHWRREVVSMGPSTKDVVAGAFSSGYWTVHARNTTYQAHRLIWKWFTGKEPGPNIDHKDRDKLHNCFWNLREATNAQNRNNAGLNRNNTSGFKGVVRHGNKWRAQIMHEGKTHRIDGFQTPEEAHQAYCEAAERLHGDFARLG